MSTRRKVSSAVGVRRTARPVPARTVRSAKKTAIVRAPRAVARHDWRPPSVGATYVWRRLHDGVLIAEASPVRGMGSWRVSAYPTANSTEAVHEQQAFSLLREAHAAADELLRRHFQHTCRTGVCGRWLRWAEE
jgi:hypothetical protein